MRQKVTSREQLLQAALKIAIKEGVDKVSVRKLASACGIGVGSMYNYYPDKDSLISAVAETFWAGILDNQDQLYRPGMEFTSFLEQYYSFLYGRLSKYDRSWLAEISGYRPQKQATVELLSRALEGDRRVNPAIWNMELNPEAFIDYVFINLTALLQTGESNCRFFIYLIDHLLYE